MREMVNYLKNLGLTEYQSRVMIVLFCKRETTAKEICKYGGIRQTKIYQVLKSLEDKGFVTYNYAKPREYHGMTQKRAMNKLLDKQEKELEKLRHGKEVQVEYLKNLELTPVEADTRVHLMWDVCHYKNL
jgi:sugar-specific transcriptional regulator TrmB